MLDIEKIVETRVKKEKLPPKYCDAIVKTISNKFRKAFPKKKEKDDE